VPDRRKVQGALEALLRPLRLAARDGFKEIEGTPNLGVALARAASRLAAALEAGEAEILSGYVAALEGFDDKARDERVRLVAQGLRLCAQVGQDRPSAPPPGPPRRPRAPGEDGRGAPLTVLRGVGERVARRLAARGLETVEDLLYFLPLEYVDQREVVPLDRLVRGVRATTCGVIVSTSARRARGRRMLEVTLGPVGGGSARLSCVWFRAYPGLEARLEAGRSLTVSGTVQRYRDQLQMAHPDLLGEGGGGIRRRYPEVEGVAPRVLERLCAEACERFADRLEDGVPPSVARELALPTQADAVRAVHLTNSEPDASAMELLQRGEHPAQRRLVFDELFSLQLAVALRRATWGERTAHPCRLSDAVEARLRGQLPFQLTGAQERVVAELRRDMALGRPMHRLLQGDVGSGKTVVAFVAAAAAMDSGLQAAVMAPTEILARQHFETMEPWARALGWHAAMITAATPRGVKESLLALADGGRIQLLVGTHALLSPRVSLPNLGLAVVDEQHRFGVLQRVRLRERPPDQPLPHLMLMTATPIPRSLALAVYGDLDLSILDEKPPGRRPPRTLLFVGEERGRAYRLVRGQLETGHQVFVVCPLVEESEKLDVADAVSTAARLEQELEGWRVGLVHGRMSAQQRAEVMHAFRGRRIDLLVATTVIEVGIDVPNASTMVVEHAERFGLAQLHQLRGRVGRGDEESLCLLLSDAAAQDTVATERLAAMARTNDGFEIAETDLRLRGPGEVFGTRQSGVPRFRFADLRSHMTLLAEAQRLARGVVERDPTLERPEHRPAREVMLRRWEGASLVGEEAG